MIGMNDPIKLKHPVTTATGEVSSVTIRPYLRSKDMIAIADHLPALAALDGLDEESSARAMNGDVIKAMVALVGSVTDLGTAIAEEMALSDMMAIATRGLAGLGELQAEDGGGAATGE